MLQKRVAGLKTLEKLLSDQNLVEIEPSGNLVFEYCNEKTIVATIKITNNSSSAKTYRVLTTNPQNYVVQPSMQFIESAIKATVTVYMICEKFLLEQRLNDKFRVEIIEKVSNDFDNITTLWQIPQKFVLLSVSFQRSRPVSNKGSIMRSGLYRSQDQGEYVESRIIKQISNLQIDQPIGPTSEFTRKMSSHTQSLHQSEIGPQTQEEKNFKMKYQSMEQRFNEQSALITKYKADIKDLHNEYEKIQFIYQTNGTDQSSSQFTNISKDQSKIPIWQVLIASVLFLIAGTIIKS